MKRSSTCVVLAVLAASLAILAPAGATPAFLTGVPVSDTNASEIHGAIGAGGVAAVAYTDAAAVPNRTRVAVHRPGGGWSAPVTLSDESSVADRPRVSVSGAGQVDTAFRQNVAGDIVARRLRADGTLEAAVPMSTGGNAFGPSIASNARGDAAVAWYQFSGSSFRVFLRTRSAGSGTWSSTITVSDATAGPGHDAQAPQVYVDPQGGVVVAWLQWSATDVGYLPKLAAVPPGSITPGATQDVPTGVVMPPAPDVKTLVLTGDGSGRVALSVVDAAGHAWAAYWNRAATPEVHDLGAASEAGSGFSGSGDPFVVVLSGTTPTQELTMYRRGASADWSDSTPLLSNASNLTQLNVGSDGSGRALVALLDGGAGGHVSVISVDGTEHSGALQVEENAFQVNDVAMDAQGDAFVAWHELTANTFAMATPYDVAGPVVTTPALPVWTLTPTSTLTWTTRDTWATTATSAVDARVARFDGGFGAPGRLAVTTGSSRVVPLTQGTTTCLTVTATDPSGNVGAPSGARCTAAPLDDRFLVRSAAWAKLTGSGFYRHTALRGTQAGLLVRRTVSAKRLALVASTCGTCGGVKVYVNGQLVRRISLHGQKRRQVVFAVASYSTARTVKVKVVTRSAAKVVLDGLGVSRS